MYKLSCTRRMPSRGRHKPAQAPSVDDLHNDSVHVPRAYGEDELPLSDGPDSVADEVNEDQVPVVDGAGHVHAGSYEDSCVMRGTRANDSYLESLSD